MNLLNNKEKKEIYNKLEEQFGTTGLKLNYLFYQNPKNNKLYLINEELLKIDLTRFNVNSFGLYFGEIENTGIRLSISGSQIIGKRAMKNVLEVEKKEEWLNGEDLECDKDLKGWFIIKHKTDFMGCGYCKNGQILNFIPKFKK